MKRLALAALVALAACRKPAAPPAASGDAVSGERMIDFDGADGSFRCRAPAEWKAQEDAHGGPLVMFFGPTSGPLRAKVSIAVTRYPDGVDRIKTPQDFWDAQKLLDRKPSPLETRQVDGRTVYALHYESPQRPPHGWTVLYMNRADVALIPTATGFFAVTHVAPSDAYRRTLPVFDDVVRSFKPKG